MTVIQFPARGRFLKAQKSDSLPQKIGRNIKTYLEVRDQEYLFEEEVQAMIQVAFKGRWGHHNSTLILMGYRHGLRISELVNLRWQQINFNTGHIHVRRVKGSRPSVHPLSDQEMRALRQLRKDYPDSAYIFRVAQFEDDYCGVGVPPAVKIHAFGRDARPTKQSKSSRNYATPHICLGEGRSDDARCG